MTFSRYLQILISLHSASAIWQREAARCLAAASTCNGRILHGCSNPYPKTFLSLILTVDLGPWFHKHSACLSYARDTDRHRGVEVLKLHYQVASDSPGGATLNSKRSKLACSLCTVIDATKSCIDLRESAPSLGVHYFLSLTLSVCLYVRLSVCHKLQIDSSFLFLDRIESFLAVSSL